MNITFVLSAIAGIAWLVVVVLLVFTILRASRKQKTKPLVTSLIVALFVALIMNSLSAGLVFVQPDQRGIVISALEPKGYREQTLEPGLRWVIPYAETVVYYPISKQTYTMSIAPLEGQKQGDDSVTARTSDGQEIFVDSSIIFHIDPTQIIMVHIDWQNRYLNDLVRPLSRGVIRNAVSQFGVEQVYSSKRTVLTQQIEDTIEKKFLENGLILDDFVLRNITFSPEYAASVEQKQVAEQNARQAAFVVQQKEQEAEQARKVAAGQADASVIQSKGDAEAIVIRAKADAEARVIQAEAEANALEKIAKALNDNPDLLTYQYINKLSPGIRVMLVPSGSPYLLPLPDMEINPEATTYPTATPASTGEDNSGTSP